MPDLSKSSNQQRTATHLQPWQATIFSSHSMRGIVESKHFHARNPYFAVLAWCRPGISTLRCQNLGQPPPVKKEAGGMHKQKQVMPAMPSVVAIGLADPGEDVGWLRSAADTSRG